MKYVFREKYEQALAGSFVGKVMSWSGTFLGFYVLDKFIVFSLMFCLALYLHIFLKGKPRNTINVNSLPRRLFEPITTKLWICLYIET